MLASPAVAVGAKRSGKGGKSDGKGEKGREKGYEQNNSWDDRSWTSSAGKPVRRITKDGVGAKVIEEHQHESNGGGESSPPADWSSSARWRRRRSFPGPQNLNQMHILAVLSR